MSGSIHSHVRRFKLQARIFFCSRSSVVKSAAVRQGKGTIAENDWLIMLCTRVGYRRPVMRRGASSAP